MTTSDVPSMTSSFILIQLFVLNLDGWFGVLSKILIIFCYFIINLYFYFNLSLSIICSFFSKDIHVSFGISVSNPIFSVSHSSLSGLFCREFLETFVVLSAILLTIKLPVVSAIFWIAVFEPVLNVSVAECLTWSRSS